MSKEQSIATRSFGDMLADVFHEFSILLRYMRFRIAERLRSPLWRFIGGQHPEDYDADLLETAAPEQMQRPEDVLIPLKTSSDSTPPKTSRVQDSQELLDLFGKKLYEREHRKRQAASRSSKTSKDSSDGKQMEFDFKDDDRQAEEQETPEDIAYCIPEGEYMLPPFTLFETKDEEPSLDTEEIDTTRKVIQDCLDNFNFDAEVGEAIHGPTVTLFKVNVGKGVRVSSIASLQNDIKMALSAPSLRILTPVPGTTYAGIEVP
ncbi:MAG: hypothetical protein J5833_08405, partial [Victivallales bacterium]|nr:hypothetical protein [Victivallales bacterium]